MYPWQTDPSGFLLSILGHKPNITSTFRTPGQNEAVGGVPNSEHLTGNAIDFTGTPQDASAIASSGLPFDQLINEGNHIHVGFNPQGERNQTFAMNGGQAPPQVMQGGMQGGQPPMQSSQGPQASAPSPTASALLSMTGGNPATHPDGTPVSSTATALLGMTGTPRPDIPLTPTERASATADPNDWRTQVMGSGYGRMMQTGMEGVYGLDQLLRKTGQAVTSLGGATPNAVSDWFGNSAAHNDAERKALEQTYARARNATGYDIGSDTAGMAGSVLSPATGVVAAGGEATTIPQMMLQGGAFAATQPTDDKNYWMGKLLQTGIGSLVGGGIGVTGKTASGIAAPTFAPGIQTLLDANVPMTIGQILRGGLKKGEDALTHIPGLGDMVTARRNESFVGLNDAAFNSALSHIGVALPSGKVGNEAYNFTKGKLTDAYDDVLSNMQATETPDLHTAIDGLFTNPVRDFNVKASSVPDIKTNINEQIFGKSDNGFYDGKTLKDIQTNLGNLAYTHGKSPDPNDQAAAGLYTKAKDIFENHFAGQNPDEAPTLDAINDGWAKLKNIEPAVAAAANHGGVFSPAQLLAGVKRGDTNAKVAAAAAPMYDLAQAGAQYLPSQLGDSGTGSRTAANLLVGALMGGGASHLADVSLPHVAVGATTLGGLAAGATQGGQTLMRNLLTKRPYGPATAAQIAAILKAGGRTAAPLAGPLANQGATSLSSLLLSPPSNSSPY